MLNVKKIINRFKHLNKLEIFQLSLILVFLLFLIFFFSAKNYTKEYKVKEVTIKELYNKKDQAYYFTLTYNKQTLDILIKSKYKQKRTFIKDIKIVKDDDNNFCLVPTSDILAFYPICSENNKPVSYNVVSNTLKNQLDSKYFPKPKKITTYKDIEIYNQDYTYFIWNYDGFYYLNNKKNKKIDLFNKELYTINLIGYTTDYLVVADFDSNYTFNKFYTVSLSNGSVKKYELDRDIYFDSFYPGYVKNKLYIVDNKEVAMYEFNAKNGKLEKISSKIYKNEKWEKINIKTLIAKKESFTYKTNYNYSLENSELYLTYKDKKIKTLVADEITSIVRIVDNNIYYLKGDSLYHYSPSSGETLLLKYFEWNFNSNNMIYVN